MDQLPWKAGLSCASTTLMVQSVMTSGMSWRQQLCVHSSDFPLKVCDHYQHHCNSKSCGKQLTIRLNGYTSVLHFALTTCKSFGQLSRSACLYSTACQQETQLQLCMAHA